MPRRTASPRYVSPFGNTGLQAAELSYGGHQPVPFQQFDTASAFNNPWPSSYDVGHPQLHSSYAVFGQMSIAGQGTANLTSNFPDQQDAAPFTNQNLRMASHGGFQSVLANDGQLPTLTGPRPQNAIVPSVPLNNQDFIGPPVPRQNRANTRVRHPTGLYFNNVDDAMSNIPPQNWSCPPNDASIPSTDVERQQWVMKLMTAIGNTKDVWDKPTAAFKKHWLDSSYYTATDKEILCWDLLSVVEDLHRFGPASLLSFDLRFWNQARKSQTSTFQQRMEKVIDLLTYSKARCEKLLGGNSMHIIVANPAALIASTKGNIKQNGKRQAFLEAGRAAKRQRTQ